MSKKAIRLLQLLNEIPNYPKSIRSSELAEKMASIDITLNDDQITRDLRACLNESSLFLHAEKKSGNAPYSWSIKKPGAEKDNRKSAKAALIKLMAIDMLQPHLPPMFKESLSSERNDAQKTLQINAGVDALDDWPNKVAVAPRGFALIPPRLDESIVNTVYEALQKDKKLSIKYKNKDSDRKLVSPLGLVTRGNVAYLVVKYDGHDNIRHLALHRIKCAIVGSDDVAKPAGFDLKAFVEDGGMNFNGNRKPRKVTLKTSAGTASYLEDMRISEDQKIERYGDDFYITGTVQQSKEFDWWVAGFEGDLVVVDGLP